MSTDEQTTLELYKLAVEMADRVSARRTSANRFFLSLHGAIAVGIGILGPGREPRTGGEALFLVLAAVAGFALAAAWWLLLKSYRDLNAAKFKVINEMESHLPARIFSDEWRYLKQDKVKGWRGRYAEQGFVERIVPVVFLLLYAVAGVKIILDQ